MLAWRFGYFVMALGSAINLLVLFIFWTAVYQDGNQIGSYSLEQLLIYYAFSITLQILMDYSFVWGVSEALHQGNLSQYLIRPISYINFLFVKEFGVRVATIASFAVPLAGVVIYFHDRLPNSLLAWILFAATTVFGFIVVSLFGILFAMTTVWFQNPHIAGSLFFTTSFLLSGRLVPIDLMPAWLASIARWSPFPFVTGMPLEFVLGNRAGFSIQELLIGLVWFVVLLFSAQRAWKWAVIKYEAGGA